MAKAIITRKIRFMPCNPNSRDSYLDIGDIYSVKTVNFPTGRSYRALKNGKTMIMLNSGGTRYSSESVEEIKRAIKEANE